MDVFWTLPPVTRYVIDPVAVRIMEQRTLTIYRTITAGAVVVSALGYSRMINLMYYVFIPQYIFTLSMIPQVWRIVTAFLITKPKFAILLDPYFRKLSTLRERALANLFSVPVWQWA